jgi:hypothetical protein
MPALLLALAGLVHPQYLTVESAVSWQRLHIALLPVFPLLAIGFLVPLWHRPGFDLAGIATVVGWVGAFVYATFYTGLDLVAGVSAGTVAENTRPSADLGASVQPLFNTGDSLGRVGVYGFAFATVGLSVVLFVRHGLAAVLVATILLAASFSFLSSHIFWPRGVITVLAIGCGFSLAAWLSTGRTGSRLSLTDS